MSKKIILFKKDLSDWLIIRFKKCFDVNIINAEISSTNNEKFGDFQSNVSLSNSKKLKLTPRDISNRIINTKNIPSFVEKIEIAGPGFINFTIKNNSISNNLEFLIKDECLGVNQVGKSKNIIIDYSSPNVAKPMHIGHIRSTVIGNALDRLYRFQGYNVIADNHLGDWGTQFGLMIIGFREYVDNKALNISPIDELERIYVKSYNRSKEDNEWKQLAKKELVKLQQGDKNNLDLWNSFVKLSLDEFEKIYKRLDIKFDLFRGESFYNNLLPDIISKLEEKNLIKESEGAKVVDLEEQGMPVCIVEKSDGGFNYTTTDLATVASRQKEFSPEKIIYVTDERQQLHFKQFFQVSKMLGLNDNLKHVWFGLMRLPEATFSTREGNVIKLSDLLDEAEKRALKIIRSSNRDLDEKKQLELAKAIGIGAIKYMDLSQNPQSLVTFTWDKALSLDGNSAPYLQYAYARISSVYDKYKEKYNLEKLEKSNINISEIIERRLAIKLLKFPDAINAAIENYKPNILCDYLYELSQLYSSYYQNLPFLKAEEGIRESRIKICSLTAKILKKGLYLLGIRTPERI
ncbi:MAG: arginine--tRNA ligase [Verrucomicrobiota bacterium]|nr:arginine--tRNA ligase [Verrucomicrobiota bacterium]